MEVDFRSVLGTPNGLKSMKKRFRKPLFFELVFGALFRGFWGAFWGQKITRFSQNGGAKTSFEAASLQGCIFGRFGGLWGSFLLDF